MKKSLIATALVLAALPVTAAQAKSDRYKGCVADSTGCTHTVEGGDIPSLRFIDREGARTRYRVCAKEIVGKQCFHGRTGKAGKADDIAIELRAAANVTVRWKVHGRQVAHWVFTVTLEGE